MNVLHVLRLCDVSFQYKIGKKASTVWDLGNKYGIKVVENIRLYFYFQFSSIQFSFVAPLNNIMGHNTCPYQDRAASKINIAPEE